MSGADTGGRRRELTKRVVSASTWALASTAAGQVLRFASNLILSRLLFPHAFGMMTIASTILAGLEMLSDVGVGPSIVRNIEPTRRFLDTLWSLQVARGWLQWTMCLLIAYPMAQWYGDHALVYLIPATGLVSVIRGYAHTSQFTLNRELRQRELFYLQICSQIVNILISVTVAYIIHSVWALVVGAYAATLTWSILTYRLASGPRHHWCWDRDVLKSISGFSRWVLMSTMLTFITNQGTSLLIGSFTSLAFLGLYSIANGIAGVPFSVITLLGERVLFPLYASIGHETTPLLKRRIIKIRLGIMCLFLPPLCALTCFGDWFVRLLWDQRYQGAGSMVQILCGGSLFLAFGIGPLYLARGEAWVGLVVGGVRAAVLLPALVIGNHLFGSIGLIYGTAISRALEYPLAIWVQRRYAVWVSWVDAVALGSSAVLITLCFLLRSWLYF